MVTFVPGTLETPWSKGVFSVRGKAPSSLSLGCRSLQYWSRNSPRCSQASSKMASSRTKSNISCVKQKSEDNTSYRKIHYLYLTETCLALNLINLPTVVSYAQKTRVSTDALLSLRLSHQTPFQGISGNVHTILDGFCTGMKIISDRASVHTYNGVFGAISVTE